MHKIFKVITYRNRNRKSSNDRFHPENYVKDYWKVAFGLKDPSQNSHKSVSHRDKHVKYRKRRVLRREGQPQVDLSGLSSGLKVRMKQLPNIKKKLGQGKKSEVRQQQNGQHKKKVKKPLGKKPVAESHIKNNLNVNERPIRKKKKTKKYESYERNGKSPEPEVKHETNLLLALGLTPVSKDGSENITLNKMHVMEEGNGKVTADAAELPETQADLPKKINPSGKGSEEIHSSLEFENPSKDLTPEPKINGVSSESPQVVDDENFSITEKTVPKKEECEVKDGAGNVRVPSTVKSIEIKEEPVGKENSQDEEEEKDKCSEPQDLTVTCTPSLENFSRSSQNEKHYSSSKIISISVEQCQMNPSLVSSISEDNEKSKKPKPISNRKRSNKSTDSEESFKTNYKRSRFAEIGHDDRERTVSEYVEKACGSSLEELQMNTEKLQQEIHSLSALARAKELEWNDIIRLKKVKEEIYLRLVRRKQVMLLTMGSSGRMSDSVNWDFASDNRMSDFVTNDEVSYNRVPPSISPKPPRIPSNLTITKSQSNPNQNLQRFLMQPQGASDPKPNTSLMMVPIVSSTPISISSNSTYLPRPQLSTPLKIPIPEKLKGVSNRNVPVPILPKPNQNVNHNVNNHSPPIGRQGPIVDVKSIIADYRQNHPEQVPRRGRRPKGQPSQNFAETMITSNRGILSMSSLALGSGSQVRTVGSNSEVVGGSGPNSGQETSRPSSADSNRSTSNTQNEVASASGVSFKDVLVQFAKMSQHQQGNDRRNSTPPAKSQASSKAPPYPEVTLHPVLPPGTQSPPNPSSSLLHGILTKSNSNRSENQNSSKSTTFSPTLARLLTTPDRSSLSTTITTALRGSNTNTTTARVSSGPVSITDLLSTSKNRNELTITPIISNLQPAKMKEDVTNISDDDPDDNADRLVIDESEEQEVRGEEEEIEGESVPECQGCHMKSAQFVCAGCGNQWYCSRNCQVTAWDEHSEVCSG